MEESRDGLERTEARDVSSPGLRADDGSSGLGADGQCFLVGGKLRRRGRVLEKMDAKERVLGATGCTVWAAKNLMEV